MFKAISDGLESSRSSNRVQMFDGMPVGDPLFSWAQKKPETLNLLTPLSKYIRDNWGQVAADSIQGPLQQLTRMRLVVRQKEGITPHTIKTQLGYCAMLKQLSTRLPITDGRVELEFTWIDTYSKRKATSNLLTFEICSVLFNAACAYCAMACTLERSMETLATSRNYFQKAAGLFEHIKQQIGQEQPALHVTPDMRSATLTMLVSLSLVNALHMQYLVELENHSPTSFLAQLAMDVAQNYSEVTQQMEHPILTSFASKDFNNFIFLTQFYCVVMEARAHIHMSAELHVKQLYGEEIARLMKAKELLQGKARGAAKQLPNKASFGPLVQKLEAVVDISLHRAQQHNQRYRQPIPKDHAMQSLQRQRSVQILPPISSVDEMNDSMVLCQNHFARLPLLPSIAQAMKLYDHEIGGLIQNEQETMSRSMAYFRRSVEHLGVITQVQHIEAGGLALNFPPHLMSCVMHQQQLASPSGCTQLLSDLIQSSHEKVLPCLAILSSLDRNIPLCKEYNRHDTVTQLEETATSILQQCEQYRQRVLAELEDFKMLDFSPERLDAVTTASRPHDPNQIAADLKRALSLMDTEQQHAQDTMNKKARDIINCDISSRMAGVKMECHVAIGKQVCKEALEVLVQVQNQMHTKMSTVFKSIVAFNSRLNEVKGYNEAIVQRLTSVVQSYEQLLIEVQQLHEQATCISEKCGDLKQEPREQPSMPRDQSSIPQISLPPVEREPFPRSPEPISKLSDVIQMTQTQETHDLALGSISLAPRDPPMDLLDPRRELFGCNVSEGKKSSDGLSDAGTDGHRNLECPDEGLEQASSKGSIGSQSADMVCDEMTVLTELHENGFIDESEYEVRKLDLSSTPTEGFMCASRSQEGSDDLSCVAFGSFCSTVEYDRQPTVIETKHALPDIDKVTKEDMEHVTKLIYDMKTGQWISSDMYCYICPQSCGEGSLRVCYQMVAYDGDKRQMYVAKESKVDDEEDEVYMRDIETQELCQSFAEVYNSYNPPKRVQFLRAFLVQLSSRPPNPLTGKPRLMHVEPYLPGEYKKHNNNWGFVCYEDRNTPQAFSHLTYVESKGQYLVVDIQGVGDMYTDPQIHSKDGEGFGIGNCGVEGMEEFFKSHKCNTLCQYLGLPMHNFKRQDSGTRANQLLSPKLSRKDSIGSPAFSQILSPRKKMSTLSSPLRSPRSSGPADPSCGYDLRYFGLTEDQFKYIRDAFSQLDVTGRGKVQKQQLLPLLRKMNIRVTLQQARDMMRNVQGIDIDFQQFLHWWTGIEAA